MQLSIVVPCFNEEETLPRTVSVLRELLEGLIRDGQVSEHSNLLFIDDGSRDRTWQILQQASLSDARVRALRLSRNRGHQVALLAGLEHSNADAVVTIDADLQDDVAAIPAMVRAAHAGADIVFGVRKQRKIDSAFKRISAETYYRILKLFGVEVVFNHADFRLMSRRAIHALLEYHEVNLFLRGIVSQLGFTTTVTYYDRLERKAGKTKFPLTKMLAFAWQGITSFSTVPLQLITAVGLVICLGSLLVAGWALWIGLMTNRAVPGWTSLLVPLTLLGGVQMLSLGIIGEYIGKIYLESKSRPRYFVSEVAGRERSAGVACERSVT